MPHEFSRDRHIFRSPDLIRVVGDAVDFLVQSPVYPLLPFVQFDGAGVYAIYYTGNFRPYAMIAAGNKGGYFRPIYVGKAVLPGWRQGRNYDISASTLCNRLKEHSRSIQSTNNLKLEDFSCRFMILEGQESNLISTVESELVRKFKPLWNSVVDGFGNHDPGSGRYNQRRSEWDTLHPGRSWADRLTGQAPSYEAIIAKIIKATS